MGGFAHIVRQAFEGLLWPFDLLPDLLSLTLLSIITGVVLLWLVGKTTPQRLVEKARNKMTAAIYEIRLYLDSPGRVFRCQGRLLGWSFIYVGVMMPALVAAALPLGLLYLHLETRFGLDPLARGEQVVLRVDLNDGVDGYQVVAEPQDGAESTAPPVFDEEENVVYLRYAITGESVSELGVRVGDHVATKGISVGSRGRSVSAERFAGVGGFWQFGDERPLSGDSPVAGISLSYPPRERSWLGIPIWWIYWLLVATVAAFALRNRMNVAI